MQLVLGSTSPYKKQLLEQQGLDVITVDSGVDERPYHQATVSGTVRVLAEVKAQSVLQRYRSTDTVIITADVAGELDGQFLGKPQSVEQARQMLQSYSGREIVIWCGTSVVSARTGAMYTDVRSATVRFRQLTNSDIDQYLAATQPLDKGGALAIEQVEQRGWVDSITGEYAAIIGLSVEFVQQCLLKLCV